MEKKKIIFKIVLPIILVLIIVAIIAIIYMPKSNTKTSAKSALDKFAKALESKEVSKVLSCIDYKGVVAWNCGFDSDDFSNSDYKDFIEEYKDVGKKESNEAKENIKEYYENFFDSGDEELLLSYDKTKKLGKDLYSISVSLAVGGKGWGRSRKKNLYYI